MPLVRRHAAVQAQVRDGRQVALQQVLLHYVQHLLELTEHQRAVLRHDGLGLHVRRSRADATIQEKLSGERDRVNYCIIETPFIRLRIEVLLDNFSVLHGLHVASSQIISFYELSLNLPHTRNFSCNACIYIGLYAHTQTDSPGTTICRPYKHMFRAGIKPVTLRLHTDVSLN